MADEDVAQEHPLRVLLRHISAPVIQVLCIRGIDTEEDENSHNFNEGRNADILSIRNFIIRSDSSSPTHFSVNGVRRVSAHPAFVDLLSHLSLVMHVEISIHVSPPRVNRHDTLILALQAPRSAEIGVQLENHKGPRLLPSPLCPRLMHLMMDRFTISSALLRSMVLSRTRTLASKGRYHLQRVYTPGSHLLG